MWEMWPPFPHLRDHLFFSNVPVAGIRGRSWRISSMDRTVENVVPLFSQVASERAIEGLTTHWPPRRVFMMPSRLIAALFLSSSLLTAQSIDASKVGTVHVSREGRFEVSMSVDGKDIVSPNRDKVATFYVLPGYHQLALRSGEISPSAAFKVVTGGEYFFKVNYERVVSARTPGDLRVSLSMQPNAGGTGEVRETRMDSK